MPIDELQQQYLRAMGIQTWVPRRELVVEQIPEVAYESQRASAASLQDDAHRTAWMMRIEQHRPEYLCRWVMPCTTITGTS